MALRKIRVNNVVRSAQNRPKILPKPSQNLLKTHLPKKTRPKHVPKSIFKASWTLFNDFLKRPRARALNFGQFLKEKLKPKWCPNPPQNAKKSTLKTSIFSNTICHRIFVDVVGPEP